jgi:hypothetical protein
MLSLRLRLLRAAFAGAALLALPAAPVHALLVDLDQVSQPRLTEPGAVSVSFCTFVTGGAPPSACVGLAEFGAIGFASDAERPLADFLVQPTIAPSLVDLWSDGHQVLANPARLLLTQLEPGNFLLSLFSHSPFATTDRTLFRVNGAGPFEVVNDINSTDLFGDQTLTLPVVVDLSGVLEIEFWSPNNQFGVLNGLQLVIPEPSTALLLAAGLAGFAAARTRDAR